MRRRPRLRTILFAVNLVILALPLGGVTVLRLYESALVRQTESELLGQAAILAAAYRAALGRARPDATHAADYGVPAASEWLPAEGRWQPRAATLDLALDSVRPRPPAAPESAAPADPAGVAAGRELMAVMQDAQAITLAGSAASAASACSRASSPITRCRSRTSAG